MIKNHPSLTQYFRISFYALCILSVLPSIAQALPRQELVPGGIALLPLPHYQPGMTAKFDGKRTAIFKEHEHWYAIGGISLYAKLGVHKFTLKYKNGTHSIRKVTVTAKKYPVQRLTISNKLLVDPNTKEMKLIIKQHARKVRAQKYWSNNTPEINFIWPTHGPISSIFGLRRFFNGQKREPHNGLDIAAPQGAPIRAVADGTVIDCGSFFFSGNMVYINHGEGIITLYAHLSKVDVKPGEHVKQGQIIGNVGHTGRATGPNLHFGVYANQSLIDPMYMLPPLSADKY